SRAPLNSGRRWWRSPTFRAAAAGYRKRVSRTRGSKSVISDQWSVITDQPYENPHENRTSSAPLRKRPASVLRRHGTCRLVADRRTGGAGPGGHAVGQRRLADACPPVLGLPESTLAGRELP